MATGKQCPSVPARLGWHRPLTWKIPDRMVMVATRSTLAASRAFSSIIVVLLPSTDTKKFSLGSRDSVTLPIMTEMTAKGPGDVQGAGREPEVSTGTQAAPPRVTRAPERLGWAQRARGASPRRLPDGAK